MTTDGLVIAPYSFDDDLVEATRADRAARWRLYLPPYPMVVLGYGSKPERELDVEACIEDGVPVFRRRGGGCSVVLDPGNVVVAATLPVEGIAGTRQLFERLTRWLTQGLERSGVAGIRCAGIFDLAVNGRKISGGSTHRTREALFWTASVLVTPRLDLMERYLRHPPREPEYRANRGHGSFVTSLAELGWKGDAGDLAIALRENLAPIGLWSPPSVRA